MFTLSSYCAPVVDHASYDLQCEYDDCDTSSYIPLRLIVMQMGMVLMIMKMIMCFWS